MKIFFINFITKWCSFFYYFNTIFLHIVALIYFISHSRNILRIKEFNWSLIMSWISLMINAPAKSEDTIKAKKKTARGGIYDKHEKENDGWKDFAGAIESKRTSHSHVAAVSVSMCEYVSEWWTNRPRNYENREREAIRPSFSLSVSSWQSFKTPSASGSTTAAR